jgi:exodeoxyribonuclease V gamma subunit
MEILAERLAEIVRDPLSSPLQPEIVIIQSKGMERWISMELARLNGISANVSFPFPNVFIQNVIHDFFPDLPDRTLFDRNVLTFFIMKLLPVCLEGEEFESLRAYLKNDRQGLKQFQLSEKIADVFDQYLVFRPEMVFSWESGKKDHWQAQLWRKLVSKTETPHRARLRADLIKMIGSQTNFDRILPERVNIFGISHLPEFYTQIFSTLSRHISVNLFLMNPCREFWSDIVSDREKKRIRKTYNGKATSDNDLHLNTGNRLLASMGTQGRDFFSIISGLNPDFNETYLQPGEKTLLNRIQTDILNLEDRAGQNGNRQSEISGMAPEYDKSLLFHSCHSPMREIEILHNNLLSMFEEDSGLTPRDIIVMTPDIDLYAPYIQAVFNAPVDTSHKIPFSIADQSVRRERPLIDGFLSLLDLKGSRFEASKITALLEYASIRKKFDLTEQDLEKIEKWIRESGIRWGIDAENRLDLGLPDYPENTWQFGMDRLLLGIAMPGFGCRMFSEILPYDHVEGHDTIILGKFIEFAHRMIKWIAGFDNYLSIAGWGESLLLGIDELFATDDDTERDMQTIRFQLEELSNIQEMSGFSKPVAFEIVQSYLRHQLETEGAGAGFISGGVTFCAMLPMRSVPFKVVCLIGMNTDAFPRESRRVAFDLIGKYPKRGDRSKRNDDRYLFLEAIVSARRNLYISFIGQNIQDNTRIPPSVLVSELIDYISEGAAKPETDIITRHPLQAFSIHYFTDENMRLFSYSEENLAAAVSLTEPKKRLHFISPGLSTPPKEWRRVEIRQMARFFSNPARFFLQNRLGIYFENGMTGIAERENFGLDPLQRYIIGQNLVDGILAGMSPDRMKQLHRADGMLPHGNAGEVIFNEMYLDAESFIRHIDRFDTGRKAEPLKTALDLSEFHLSGDLNSLYENGLLRVRYSNTRGRDLVSAWIFHLVYCAACHEMSKTTLLICKDSGWQFSPVADSKDRLYHLLDLYWKGLSKPLRFFPESSLEYCRRIAKGNTRRDAHRAACRKWEGNPFSGGWGESDDPYYSVCFRNEDPIADRFENLSTAILDPLLNHCREVH